MESILSIGLAEMIIVAAVVAMALAVIAIVTAVLLTARRRRDGGAERADQQQPGSRMKRSHQPWVTVSVLVLFLVLVLMVLGATMAAGWKLARRSDAGIEATMAALATADANLLIRIAEQATPSVSPSPDLTLPDTAATDTPLPTATPEPPTPTTARPTATSKPVGKAEPTQKPTRTPAPASVSTLQVVSFTASPDPVQRGGALTLAWDVPGAASVGITRLSEEGDIFLETEALDLPASGSLAVHVPEEYVESVKYYLGARDAAGVLYKAYVRAGIICRYDGYLAPRCPLTQDEVWAAYEPFERGHMIWRSDTREIYVLTVSDDTGDGGSYETYEDTWQEGDPVDIPGTPPPGLYAPVRGFGNLYANQPPIREKLGWALAPEAGYTMWVETIPGGSGRYPGQSIYFTLPDGRVVNLYPFTSTWKMLL